MIVLFVPPIALLDDDETPVTGDAGSPFAGEAPGDGPGKG